jgi:hypothetical protein
MLTPWNQTTSEWCQSWGQDRGATRCSRRGHERRWWWCHCRSHHGCHGLRRRGFRGCRKWSAAAIGGGGTAHQREAQLTGEEAQLAWEAVQPREGGYGVADP